MSQIWADGNKIAIFSKLFRNPKKIQNKKGQLLG